MKRDSRKSSRLGAKPYAISPLAARRAEQLELRGSAGASSSSYPACSSNGLFGTARQQPQPQRPWGVRAQLGSGVSHESPSPHDSPETLSPADALVAMLAASKAARSLSGYDGMEDMRDEADDNLERTSKATWADVEDGALLAAVAIHGTSWHLVATAIPGRTADAVRNRWHRLRQQQRAPHGPGDPPAHASLIANLLNGGMPGTKPAPLPHTFGAGSLLASDEVSLRVPHSVPPSHALAVPRAHQMPLGTFLLPQQHAAGALPSGPLVMLNGSCVLQNSSVHPAATYYAAAMGSSSFELAPSTTELGLAGQPGGLPLAPGATMSAAGLLSSGEPARLVPIPSSPQRCPVRLSDSILSFL